MAPTTPTSEPELHESVTRPARPGRLAALRAAIDEGAVRSAERMLSKLHPAEIAQLLESLPQKRREIVWELTDPELDGDVLVELSDEVRAQLIGEMEPEELAAATENLEIDDLADLVAHLPETVTQQLLRNMDQQDRERLSRVLEWPEDSAGGLMSTDTVSVRADVSVEVVQRYLRMRGELPERTDRLFAVDRHDRFLGTITLSRLLTEDPETLVGASLDADAPRIAPETPAAEVSQIFRDRDLVSAPVVDEAGRLLGPHHHRRCGGRDHRKKPRTRSWPAPACATRKTSLPASCRPRADESCGWPSTCSPPVWAGW